jgi:hypothetical protein
MIITDLKNSLFKNAKRLKKDEKVKLHPYNINSDITFLDSKHFVIYDFVNEKIFKKDLSIKDGNLPNPYKNEKGEDIDFDMYDYIEENSTKTMIEYSLPEGNFALAIFDDKIYTHNDKDLFFYMIYHSSLNQKILKFDQEYINNISYNLTSKDLHWVWFRMDDSRLPSLILERCRSWIDHNPEINFHLWTNLISQEESKEWFKDIPDNLLQFFLQNVTIHYKHEMYDVVKNFCEKTEETFFIWSFMYEVLENYGDRGSMIFKTDLVRCMILYNLGGWYSDFNDTICFTPLKYIINPLNPEMIYIGCDYNHKDCNNYIMYCPKGDEKWFNNTKKLINYSYRLYKILEIKDEIFTNFIQSMIKSFAEVAEKANERYIFDIFGILLDKWINLYNKNVEEMLSRNNITLPLKLEFDMNKFVLLIKFILLRENPESPLVKRYLYEFSYLKNIVKIKDIYRPLWKIDKPKDPYIMDEVDHKYWKNHSVSKNAIYDVFIQTNIKALIYMTNMGSFYQKVDNNNPMYRVPYCYMHENFCFLTVIGHALDCSCTGAIKDYSKNYL